MILTQFCFKINPYQANTLFHNYFISPSPFTTHRQRPRSILRGRCLFNGKRHFRYLQFIHTSVILLS